MPVRKNQKKGEDSPDRRKRSLKRADTENRRPEQKKRKEEPERTGKASSAQKCEFNTLLYKEYKRTQDIFSIVYVAKVVVVPIKQKNFYPAPVLQ
jgi:hypothetical protein